MMHGYKLWIWLINLMLNALILVSLKKTKLHEVMPFFTTLIVFAIASGCILHVIRTFSPYFIYRYAYALAELGDIGLQLYNILRLGNTKNIGTRWIAFSLWLYFVLEGLILIQAYYIHFGHWALLTRYIQPLYISFQISWLLVIWRISNKTDNTTVRKIMLKWLLQLKSWLKKGAESARDRRELRTRKETRAQASS